MSCAGGPGLLGVDLTAAFDAGGRSWPGFTVRTVVLPGGTSVEYEEAEWRGTLVIVVAGLVELETIGGARRGFGAGDVLFFAGLRLRALHNANGEDVVLQAVSRAPSTRGQG